MCLAPQNVAPFQGAGEKPPYLGFHPRLYDCAHPGRRIKRWHLHRTCNRAQVSMPGTHKNCSLMSLDQQALHGNRFKPRNPQKEIPVLLEKLGL